MPGIKNEDDVEVVDCPICGPAPFRVWMEDGHPTRYVKCLECKTIYASPRASWASRYAWLDSKFGISEHAEDNARIRRPALKVEAGYIYAHVTEGKLLDVGCDLGDFFEMFPSPDWERYGVELAPSAAAYASEKQAAKVYAGTLKSASFPDNFFDVVTLIDLIYYMDDPNGELEEIFRITKPGGVLAIEAPGQSYQMNRSKGIVPLILDRKWTRLRTNSAYINWYTPTGLNWLLIKNGFTPLEWKLVSSPIQQTGFRAMLTRIYVSLMGYCSKIFPTSLTFAPKYFCIAKKNSN